MGQLEWTASLKKNPSYSRWTQPNSATCPTRQKPHGKKREKQVSGKVSKFEGEYVFSTKTETRIIIPLELAWERIHAERQKDLKEGFRPFVSRFLKIYTGVCMITCRFERLILIQDFSSTGGSAQSSGCCRITTTSLYRSTPALHSADSRGGIFCNSWLPSLSCTRFLLAHEPRCGSILGYVRSSHQSPIEHPTTRCSQHDD